MADSSAAQECENPSETEIEETNKSAKAVKLLREVTQLLLDENDLSQLDKKERQSPLDRASEGSDQILHSRPSGHPGPQMLPGQVGASGVLNKFRRIFAPYERPHKVALQSTFQPRYKHQKQKSKQTKLFFQPKETWTHEFFCLALKNRVKTPSRAEKFELQQCGLGRRKICFHSKASFTEFQQKLYEEYPKLKEGGGFVIMRTGLNGSNNVLTVVPSPASGYSVPFLRDCSGLGQALVYLRPLQRDLDK